MLPFSDAIEYAMTASGLKDVASTSPTLPNSFDFIAKL